LALPGAVFYPHWPLFSSRRVVKAVKLSPKDKLYNFYWRQIFIWHFFTHLAKREKILQIKFGLTSGKKIFLKSSPLWIFLPARVELDFEESLRCNFTICI
jgi:hypothetical protein